MITLILGGARSGKSALAEELAARLAPPVTYLATLLGAGSAGAGPDGAGPDGGSEADAAVARRIAAHRARRPADWATIEVGPPPAADLAGTLRATAGTILVDSLGPWLAAHDGFAVDARALCATLTARSGDTVIVSDEVGLGVQPATELGGQFRDALGSLNQAVAAAADAAYLAVAGRALPLHSAWQGR